MSKRFAFPLQKALDWYRQSLAVEQASLERIIGEVHGLDRLKESLERRQHSEHEELQRANLILGKDLRGLANYSALIRADLARLAAEKSRKEASLVEQRRKADWVRGVSVEEDSLASDVFLASMSRKTTRNRASGSKEQNP